MTAYNRLNGLHLSENPLILEDVLRGEWGWKGMVMSDWFGTYSADGSVKAGLDLEMPVSSFLDFQPGCPFIYMGFFFAWYLML